MKDQLKIHTAESYSFESPSEFYSCSAGDIARRQQCLHGVWILGFLRILGALCCVGLHVCGHHNTLDIRTINLRTAFLVFLELTTNKVSRVEK